MALTLRVTLTWFPHCPESMFSPQYALKGVAVTWWQSQWPICHCPCNDLKTLWPWPTKRPWPLEWPWPWFFSLPRVYIRATTCTWSSGCYLVAEPMAQMPLPLLGPEELMTLTFISTIISCLYSAHDFEMICVCRCHCFFVVNSDGTEWSQKWSSVYSSQCCAWMECQTQLMDQPFVGPCVFKLWFSLCCSSQCCAWMEGPIQLYSLW